MCNYCCTVIIRSDHICVIKKKYISVTVAHFQTNDDDNNNNVPVVICDVNYEVCIIMVVGDVSYSQFCVSLLYVTSVIMRFFFGGGCCFFAVIVVADGSYNQFSAIIVV